MGGRIYDAHIAEIARLAGARLVATENRRHFTPLLRHGIRVLVSAELSNEIGLTS
jgi:predicted nucleic acid-binding protein